MGVANVLTIPAGSITDAQLAPGGFGSPNGNDLFPPSAGAVTSFQLTNNNAFYLQIDIPRARTITGVVYWVGGTQDATAVIRSAMNNAGGGLLTTTNPTGSAQPAANQRHRVPFVTSGGVGLPIAVSAGTYWAQLCSSSATATAQAAAAILAQQGTVASFGFPQNPLTPPDFPAALAAFPLFGFY